MKQNLFSKNSSQGLPPIHDRNTLNEYALYSQVADMYYNQEMKLSEIAAVLNFSVAKVSRILAAAREKGVVDIQVKRITGRLSDMEMRLKKLFHLRDVIVVTSFGYAEYEQELDVVTDFAASYISDFLKGKKILGVSNGVAVNNLVKKIQPLHACDLDIVQLVGSGTNAHQDIESRDLVSHVASIFPGGHCFFLNTPIYINNVFAKEELLRDTSVQQTFNMMRQCDAILTGIGMFNIDQRFLPANTRDYQTDTHLREMHEKQAIGSICSQFYDTNGQFISCEWNNKCLAMPLDEIRKNQMTVAIVCGKRRVPALLGALHGNLINVLITSEQVASGILQSIH